MSSRITDLENQVAELESVLQNVAEEVLEIRRQAEVNRAHGGEVNDAAATTAEGLLEHLEHALGPDRVAAARAEDEAFESMLTKHHDEVRRLRSQLAASDAEIARLREALTDLLLTSGAIGNGYPSYRRAHERARAALEPKP